MKTIDLNADIGESETAEGQSAEREVLRYITSANIACGGHAGNDETMRATVKAAKSNHVVIGAHPGYPDPKNFGRKSMPLGDAKLTEILKQSLTEQIVRLTEIAAENGVRVAYVKPHGALYNDAVKSPVHADLIAQVIAAIDPALYYLGGPNSEMGKAASRKKLTFINEGFIDRRYTDDGHLQSRSIDGAIIDTQSSRMKQARLLISHGHVITASGKTLPIYAQSLCLHGDSDGAVETARQVLENIEKMGVTIQSFIPDQEPLHAR